MNSRDLTTYEDFKKVVCCRYTNTYKLFVWNIAETLEWSQENNNNKLNKRKKLD